MIKTEEYGLIDEFAKSALQGLMVDFEVGGDLSAEDIGKIAYEMAEEMFKARKEFQAEATRKRTQGYKAPTGKAITGED